MTMATVMQRRQGLQQLMRSVEPNSERWIDAAEEFNLRKASASDFISQGLDEQQAERAVAALRRHDLPAFGDVLGIRVKVKFKVWAERDGLTCRIKADGAENANWLRDYISSAVPKIRVTEPTNESNSRLYRFTVTCGDDSGPWRLQRSLIECPAIIAMEIPVVRIIERPHYRVEARDLAAWIDDQGEGTWWRVDGDPLLMGLLDLPCPPEELSAALRSIDKPLLVDDPDDFAAGQLLALEEVDRVVTVNRMGMRRMFLTWEDGTVDWLLSEADEVSQRFAFPVAIAGCGGSL
jgi:hypothetical protein